MLPASTALGLAAGSTPKLGIDGRTGSIAIGKDADLVLIDSKHAVKRTWVKGRSV